jgi:putative peptidoglycan lipid II flippase
MASNWPTLHEEVALALLVAIGALVYSAALLLLFGPRWLAALRRRSRAVAAKP